MLIQSPHRHPWSAEDQGTYATWRRAVVLIYCGLVFVLIGIDMALHAINPF
jgi:hypothetical protein